MNEDRAPSCEFGESSYDFGETGVGDELSHEFCFRNAGNSLLHVRRVLADCGCVVHALDKKHFRPGETGSVRISLDTSGLSAPRAIEHSIWFEYSCAGEIAGARLHVAALLSPDIECSPREVTLASHELSELLHARVTIDRRMISSRDFEQLAFEKISSCITIRELFRTRDRIVIDIAAEQEEAMRGPQVIDLLYEREGELRNQKVVVRFPPGERRATIRPPSYIAIASTDELPEGESDSSRRAFQILVPGHGDYRIVSLKASENLGGRALKWQVQAETPDQFELWVEHWPSDNEIVRTDLTITYCDVSGTTKGQCSLPVYISQ